MSTGQLVRHSDSNSAPTQDSLFTFLRSAALVVVVLWHWVFATVRWDATGPRSGNPLHLVTGGFVLTWFLQVMPLFFILGGWASKGSYQRSLERGEVGWVRKRIARLVRPVIPLLAALIVAKLAFSPWLFGVVLLAVSPLWFLGVYVPLTALTPVLVRAPRASFLVSIVGVLVIQYVHVVLRVGGLTVALLSFLCVWGTTYQLGFALGKIRNNRRLATASLAVGVTGIIAGSAFGYSLSMVTRVNDSRSNMGPPTIQIVFLALFQLGLIGVLQRTLSRIAAGRRMTQLATFVDSHQMKIYAIHLPIWVGLLVLLRNTPLAVGEHATPSWLALRPVWLILPGAVLLVALRRPIYTSQPPLVRGSLYVTLNEVRTMTPVRSSANSRPRSAESPVVKGPTSS